MVRSILIYLSKALWAQRLVTGWSFAWRTASRFVAGAHLEDALRVVADLNSRGINCTLDHLGENTSTRAEAESAADEIIATLDGLAKNGACSNVSIKLTQIGLGLDSPLCQQNLERILSQASLRGNFVRIDIEDTPYTDPTIAIFYEMRARGFRNVGMALQSYLYRSAADASRLLADEVPIRLVKGAYQVSADKAFPRKGDVDSNFDLLTKMLIDASLKAGSTLSRECRFPPIAALATHDERRIAFAKSYARSVGLPKDGMEFQMLYGIRRDLQDSLSAEGYPVRVYVPFGTHWYPYFVRRLAERPANIWFFLSNLFRA